jgi:hypothetical protein
MPSGLQHDSPANRARPNLRTPRAILRRGGRRPQYTAADGALLAAVSRRLPPERWSCFAVSPQTLRRWHRALLQGKRGRRGRRPGRRPLAAATRSLILRLARENPRWGYLRIEGELLKLGINVSATTVATVLRVSRLGPAPRRIGPSWSEFLRAQAQSMLAAGLACEPATALRSGPLGRCKVCRGCRPSPLCLLPATRRPRHCRSSQQWQARDRPRARRRSLHARTVRTGVNRVDCSHPTCE